MRRSSPFVLVTLLSAGLAGLSGAPASLAAQSATAADAHPAHRSAVTRATVVLLVRHGEKAAAPAGDPALSEGGAERARALADALGASGVSAIVVTPLIRTRATAQPLADRLGLTPEAVPLDGGVEGHARAVAAAVRRHAGEAVLVVGHSNTVPAIIAALGGPAGPDICDAEYSNLFVLVLQPPAEPKAGAPAGNASGPAQLVRSHYGRPDDPAAVRACDTMTPR